MPPDTSNWVATTQQALDRVAFAPRAQHRGQVEEIGDGVAMVSGLRDVRLDEVLRFAGGQVGFARVLDPDLIGCVMLDADTDVEAGDTVLGTGTVVTVPVGQALLGRIVDPLGRPLDGKGTVKADAHLPIERPAPSIIERDLVSEPVQTGIMVVDTLFALGRGQRELIVGDHSTGKTSLAVDAMIAQRDSDMICIYVAVGQKTSSVRRAIDALQTHGDFSRCIVVVAGAASAPGLQWIAPYAGMSMAEYFRDRGQHALIVIDDLSKHAATHREIALLTRQSPGREAFPGDVFYIHARLLERAAKLSDSCGGGSLTALPIAETDAGNLSAYIPTNLISITDGQLVLNATLFHQGQKPAVDVGLSVSRVGGKTQAPVLRKAAGTLRLDYAQFLELEVFSRFGGMPEGRVRQQLARGARIREILRQPQHAPFRLADEIALMLALQTGLLDTLPLEAVADFRAAVPATLDQDAPEIPSALATRKALEPPLHQKLMVTLEDLAASLSDTAAKPPDTTSPPGKPMSERLADISARIRGIEDLGAVVNAMKGIAAARAHGARDQLHAVDSYAATIAAAMSRLLNPDPAAQDTRRTNADGKPGILAFCAEQGFAGAFSERVLDSLDLSPGPVTLFLVGTRGLSVAAARGIVPYWSAPLPSHTPGIPKLADRITTAIYRAVAEGRIDSLDVLYTGWGSGRPTLTKRRLFPIDLADLPPAATARPLTQLPDDTLIASLGQDYFNAQACRAALHAFAAENQARMEAMTAAGTQIARELDKAQALLRRVRQEAITAEIIELGTGAAADR